MIIKQIVFVILSGVAGLLIDGIWAAMRAVVLSVLLVFYLILGEGE